MFDPYTFYKMSYDTRTKIIQLVQTVTPHIIDHVEIGPLGDKGLDVRLFMSFECEDGDELDDIFQAILDIMCSGVVSEREVWAHGTMMIWYPGATNEDDMYDEGESASVSFDEKNNCIDVRMRKRDRNTRNWRLSSCVYEL